MKEIGIDLARELLAWLKATKGFVLDQAPDVAIQIIAWKRAEATLQVVIGALIVGLAVWLLRLGVVFGRKNQWIGEEEIPCFVFGGFGLIAGVLSLFCGCNKFLHAWLAPKVFLIEYLSNLVTK